MLIMSFQSPPAMHEIICPHCSKAFKIDEAGYADILKQVRDGAFEQQLHERLELAEQDKRNAVELAQAKAASEMQKSAVAKDSEIQALKAKLDAGELARKLAATEALSDVQKERDALANELAQARHDKLAATELAEAKLGSGLQNAAANRLAPRGLAPILKLKFSQISVTASRNKSAVIGRPRFSNAVMSSGAGRAGLVHRARIFLMALSAGISCNCNWFIKNSSGCCTSMP